MNARAAKGKGQRAYDASGRQARALRHREAALDRAHELFLERGYVATTVEAIASAAGVSAATVYKTYGGKAGLVRSSASALSPGRVRPPPTIVPTPCARAATPGR